MPVVGFAVVTDGVKVVGTAADEELAAVVQATGLPGVPGVLCPLGQVVASVLVARGDS